MILFNVSKTVLYICVFILFIVISYEIISVRLKYSLKLLKDLCQKATVSLSRALMNQRLNLFLSLTLNKRLL